MNLFTMGSGLLLLLLVLPLIAAAAAIVARRPGIARTLAVATSGAQLLIALALWAMFDAGAKEAAAMQFTTRFPWAHFDGAFGALRIDFSIGVDGVSLPLVALASLVFLAAHIVSRTVEERRPAFYALMLTLNAGVIGSLVALDWFLFYLCWELTLVPLYFLIAMWGGARREYAAMKFFLTMLAGSALMLPTLIALYYSSSIAAGNGGVVHTFDMLALMNPANYLEGSILAPGDGGRTALRTWGFVALFGAFAVRLPMFPLHTWFTDAQQEAPMPVSIVLACLVPALGGYGILRVCCSIFPDVVAVPAVNGAIAGLGAVGVAYGALCALATNDLKRVLAYATIAQMGLVLLGIASLNPAGLSGAVYQLVAHGVAMALLLIVVGSLQDRVGDRSMANFGGVGALMPRLGLLCGAALAAGLALPGLAGLWGGVQSLVGAFAQPSLRPWAVLAVVGTLLAAAAAARLVRGVFMGTLRTPAWGSALGDLRAGELGVMAPLAAVVVALGVWPAPVVGVIDAGVGSLMNVAMLKSNALALSCAARAAVSIL